MAKNLTVLEKRCEDCDECKTIKGIMVCHEMWDRPCNEVGAEDCPLEIGVEEVAEINAKKIKVEHGAQADIREKKKRKAPTRKPDLEKEALISKIAEFLTENGHDDVKITNKSKIIEFNVGQNHYKLDLIHQRKPKK